MSVDQIAVRSQSAGVFRPLISRFADQVSVRDFDDTAGTLGYDSSPAFAAAMAALAGTNRRLLVPYGDYQFSKQGTLTGTINGGAYSYPYAFLNPGVSMVGEGGFATIFSWLSALTDNTTCLMLIRPPAGELPSLSFEKLTYWPNLDGTTRGGVFLRGVFDRAVNMPNFWLHQVMHEGGAENDFTLDFEADRTLNPQGAPSIFGFSNSFLRGYRLKYCGDSPCFLSTDSQTAVGSARTCSDFLAVNASGGVAACPTWIDCNMNGDGGAVLVREGRLPRIIGGNIAQTHGAGTPSGAVIEFAGTSTHPVSSPYVDTHIEIFGSPTITKGIHFGYTENGVISDGSTVYNGTGTPIAAAVSVSANAKDTIVGATIAEPSVFTSIVADAGQGTRGVIKTVASFSNSFANYGSGLAAAAYTKSRDGLVSLSGGVSAPASPNNKVIFVLPVGFRPTATVAFACMCSGGSSRVAEITVDASGNVTAFDTDLGGFTLIWLNGVSFPTPSQVTSSSY